MKRYRVKICGITNAADGIHAVRSGADALGFVMVPESPRSISPEAANSLISAFPAWTVPVAVTVNASNPLLTRIRRSGFTWIQLSGYESAARVASIRSRFPFHIIKTIHVRTRKDLTQASNYGNLADLFLFDTATTGMQGGTGQRFDWSILDAWHGGPFLLAGGLDPESIEDAVETIGHPDLFGFDVSSRLESAPGFKDPDLVLRFFANLYGASWKSSGAR